MGSMVGEVFYARRQDQFDIVRILGTDNVDAQCGRLSPRHHSDWNSVAVKAVTALHLPACAAQFHTHYSAMSLASSVWLRCSSSLVSDSCHLSYH